MWRLPSTIYAIYKVTRPDGSEWQDESFPNALAFENFDLPFAILRIEADAALPPADAKAFHEFLTTLGMNADTRYVIILRGKKTLAYAIDEEGSVKDELSIIPAQASERRLSENHDLLTAKCVAILGCGSLGSKVGTMLARTGVGSFVLIDDDVLLPDNLVRNDLDWRDVGTHKVDALARKMQLINPQIKTRVRRMQLGGQESAGSAETLLTMLTECDLIIDATANPDSFNIVAAVSASTKRAVVWAEVFGGGIGGLVARSRPGLEPSPQMARRAIENWFAEQDAPPLRTTRGYGNDADSGPMFANDADVSSIAAPAARLAIDTLLATNPSLFPNSAYAIGLANGSVFSQPFDTRPIDLGPPDQEIEKEELGIEDAKDALATIVGMFIKK